MALEIALYVAGRETGASRRNQRKVLPSWWTATSTDSALNDASKEALDAVDPGGTGPHEVDVPTPTALNSDLDLGMLLDGFVVDDEVD
jgi:hypothetical protein